MLTKISFGLNGVKYGKFVSLGVPILDIHPLGKFEVNDGLVMVNNARFATLGKNNRCKFVVGENAKLRIGSKVGVSNITIVSTKLVIIGNNVMIGGGVTIVDTDFHSLNPDHWHTEEDPKHMQQRAVTINDNVFIGMNVIILKGVTIGENAIIAAGAVVSKDIPGGQIWGGNPAKFIRMR